MKKIVAVLFLIACSNATAYAGDCYSEGARVGVVQKFSQKGVINKSWEGEMVQDGVRAKASGQGAASTNIWKFSVMDPVVAKQLDDAVFSGDPVAVRYCQQGSIKLLGKTDTEYLITAVRVRK